MGAAADLKTGLDMGLNFLGNETDNYGHLKVRYDTINKDLAHAVSRDDICTPMACVERMLDYLPQELWRRKNLKILDPCVGNGNFVAYAKCKTSLENIHCNELSKQRFLNCVDILNPKHITNQNFFDINTPNTYDLIMANPPYSGGGNKNRSLSNRFIEHAIDLLKDQGFLCFVTPNNWMTYNNNNTTLKKLLSCGSFLVLDNDIKKYFKGIGSSFVVFVWQKGVFGCETFVKNGFLQRDCQRVKIPKDLPFLPLYLSDEILSLVKKCIGQENNAFTYRCDLHNFTQKDKLSDTADSTFQYETIHTPKKTRYAKIKQDIYDKWIIVIPLSTYFLPYIKHHANTTQSVGYIAFENEKDAKKYSVQILDKVVFARKRKLLQSRLLLDFMDREGLIVLIIQGIQST
ncbi:MTS domain-containing protein/DNA methyltrasferase [Helicobacter sp. NHP21005]|uniref:Eco57I restriction-modification methylase domain-containing protein n=1 Tax=Helicobacter felistomachi TaxID=3040201 RepID=UPI00257303E6|nr:methyltransferase [Helicobacter sp. NHP21005]BEG57576.1 MTS domain-containing protein/DNA methyltrasferase [Helicobacter sp. NHP21005]